MHLQVRWKSRQKREKPAPADLLLFQKRLEARIQLFQELKETESVAMDEVVALCFLCSLNDMKEWHSSAEMSSNHQM